MIKQLFVSTFIIVAAMQTNAQSCGNDELYKIPYKNTYFKEPLVAENEFRVAKPQTIEPKKLCRS